MNKVFHILIELIFPPDEEERLLHKTSLQKFRQMKGPSDTPHHFIQSTLSYKNPRVRLLVHKIKYNAHPHALNIGSTLLQEELLSFLSEKQQFGEFNSPILIPLPIHKERLKERGWNQSELLVKKISVDTNIPYTTNVLKKIKNTPSQTSLSSRASRLKNPKNSFIVKNETEIEDKDVIVIDDVTTTGATLKEACLVLKKTRAKNVIAITLAH